MLRSFIKLIIESPKFGDNYLYTYVPTAILPMIKKYGLLAGRSLLSHPDAIKELSFALNISPMKIRKLILASKVSHLGPKILFNPPPSKSILSKNHPNILVDSTLVKIDWLSLKKDYPDAKIWGMQLNDNPSSHWLDDKDVSYYMSLSSSELWNSYNDEQDLGSYAPNVPHGRISISGGSIEPEYISIV